MTRGIFRIRLPDGDIRLARGPVDVGPNELLDRELTIATLLADGPAAVSRALEVSGAGPVPADVALLPPVDVQEIWAAGVTYERSRDARMEEAVEPSIYDRVYDAARPELFFKAAAWRVRGPRDAIGIRADSAWDVPEPELAVVASSGLEICGFAIGNDVSSRTIEGDNPLYLPQAKSYDGSCALGVAIVPASEIEPPFTIHLTIERDGVAEIDEVTSTIRLRRSLDDLLEHVGRAMTFPSGLVLLTGTGIVPPPEFTLRAGDLVRIAVDGLGQLENRVEVVGRAGPAR